MQRKFRLTSSTSFQRVRRLGKSYAHPLIVFVAFPNQQPRTQCGVAAGRSVGNAVLRNRAKRWIREALRPWLNELQPGWDVVLLARKGISTATFQETQAALLSLLQRAHILKRS